MAMKKKLSYELLFYPDDPKINPYRLLPFVVPPKVRTIEIQYFYDKNGENTIDLGLFDPRGTAFLQGPGFRGWSGSARSHVIVSEKWATPGYLPGPILPGTWHVLLGLYKIGRTCACLVDIVLHDEEIAMEPKKSEPLPSLPIVNSGWLGGDLHCHTCHSDAEGTVEEILTIANLKGLNFLAITDHNTVSHLEIIKELSDKKLLIVPAEEVTTYKGHANVFGLWKWVDFRCTRDSEVKAICDFVHAQNGLFSINHPKENGPNWEFSLEFDFDCMEIWQAFWQLKNSQSLELWDSLLQRRRRIIAIGGSDAHPRRLKGGNLLSWLGYPTTWIYTKKADVEEILQAIKSGYVSISACPYGPLLWIAFESDGKTVNQGGLSDCSDGKLRVYVTRGKGLSLGLVSCQGCVITEEHISDDSWERTYELNLSELGYVRAELFLRLPNGVIEVAAITNPIWYRPWLEAKGGSP